MDYYAKGEATFKSGINYDDIDMSLSLLRIKYKNKVDFTFRPTKIHFNIIDKNVNYEFLYSLNALISDGIVFVQSVNYPFVKYIKFDGYKWNELLARILLANDFSQLDTDELIEELLDRGFYVGKQDAAEGR